MPQASVDPAVAIRGGRFLAVLPHVHLEFPARSLAFPVGQLVARSKKERAAAQIQVPYQDTAEMSDVAYVIAAATGAQRREKFNGYGAEHIDLHWYRDR